MADPMNELREAPLDDAYLRHEAELMVNAIWAKVDESYADKNGNGEAERVGIEARQIAYNLLVEMFSNARAALSRLSDQDEPANDARALAERLFEGIALRVDRFFKAKGIQGGVRSGDDLFSPLDKHELAASIERYVQARLSASRQECDKCEYKTRAKKAEIAQVERAASGQGEWRVSEHLAAIRLALETVEEERYRAGYDWRDVVQARDNLDRLAELLGAAPAPEKGEAKE